MVSGLEEAAGPRGARGRSGGWGAACDMGASSLVEDDCRGASACRASLARRPRIPGSVPSPLPGRSETEICPCTWIAP